jgi:uncharacterized repeat protein (TIGR03803 family)
MTTEMLPRAQPLMNTSSLSRCALSFCATAAMLAACGGSQPPIVAPAAMPQPPAVAPNSTMAHHSGDTSSSYQIVYRFAGGADGQQPQASLIDVNGTLYGTTTAGGAYCEESDGNGCGTVFSVSTTGSEKVLHSFGNGTDGIAPTSSLIVVNGVLYGTTAFGGGYCAADGATGCGTVFSINPTDTEQVLHRFGGGSDGAVPYAGLIDVKSTLYGTTAYGGDVTSRTGLGTVFRISTDGKEQVLHNFGISDGWHPEASLIDVNRVLYGTTNQGGTPDGDGMVFSISAKGAEQVLRSFLGHSPNGGRPLAALVDVAGELYGTTEFGGAFEDGVVFKIGTDGKTRRLHSFGGGSDGANPTAGLIDVNGTLYGTTVSGGAHGYGTVFSVTPEGTEQVLYSFAGYPSDGESPWGGLLDVNGTLYGTTRSGGTFSTYGSYGTVFALTP